MTERFTGFLGEAKSKRDLSTLQASDVARFRDRESTELSRSTANLGVKVLRICLGEAVRQGLLAVNPAVRVKLLKSAKESKRRAFTLHEIRRILRACADNAEWRGLVLFGLYLGQRLGDLAKLTWRAVDLDTGEVAFSTRKTDGASCCRFCNRSAITCLHCQRATTQTLSSSRERRAQSARLLCRISSGKFSLRADLLNRAGHKSTGKGRNQAREASEISFHSLRHSAVTMLKAAGVSDFMAREIVGHESAAICRQYTHLTTDDKRAALLRVPDVTKPESVAELKEYLRTAPIVKVTPMRKHK